MVKVRNFIFVTLLLLLSMEGYCADPPAPSTASTPPPPVGLPLPIDDYLPLLLLAGLIYGAIKIPKLQNN